MVTALYSVGVRGLGVVFSEPAQGLWQTAALSRQYAVIKTCDAQRHLVAAGTLTRDGVDGAWGPNSRAAMARFVNALPSTIRGLVYTDASGQPAALPFGQRDDYRTHSGTEIRVPSAYVLAFPPKANVPCTGGASSGGASSGGASSGGASSGEDTPDATGPSLEEQLATSREGAGAASGGFSPWLILAGVALGAIGISAAMRRRSGGMNGLGDEGSDCGCGG